MIKTPTAMFMTMLVISTARYSFTDVVWSTGSTPLERLQVFEQRTLTLGRQIRAVAMSGIRVPRLGCVVHRPESLRLGAVRDKSHLWRVVHVVAAPEPRRPALGCVQQIGQRRNRAVV